MQNTDNRTKQSSSVGQVFKHFKNGSFGIVSASRENLHVAENNKRTRELLSLLKSEVIQYIPVVGKYGIKENSMFLMDVEPELVKAIAERYDQYSYIWGEKGAWAEVITATGNIEQDGTKFLVSSVVNEEDFYSKVKGRKFKLAEE